MPHLNQQRATPRTGFTLLELVLALSVLAILIGLTWPSLMRFVGDQRLRDDVELVRSRAAAVRSSAIAERLTFQFRYEPGGTRYLILPYERPLTGRQDENLDATSAGSIDDKLRVRDYELDEGNRFSAAAPSPLGSTSQPPLTEQISQDWLALFGGEATLAQTTWSEAILFKPDGSATDTEFFVVDDDGRYQRIAVRGLTAAVSSGPVQQEDRR